MSTVQPISQNDPLWKSKRLGFDNSNTIGKWGCLLTCMTMVGNRFGYDETPKTLNDKLVTLGPNVGFIGAMVIPASMPRVLPNIVYRDYLQCRDVPAPVDRIDAALAAGMPVIVEVDYSPARGLQNHWIVIYAKQGGDYLIRDPWPYPAETGEVLLTSRYGFAGKPAQIIQSVLWFNGPTQPMPIPGPSDEPQDALMVTPTVDGLALRQQPVITATNLLKREPLAASLRVLEPQDEALAKVGVVNQWLNVRDPQGVAGYVAAWYISAPSQAQQPGPTPSPEPQPEPEIPSETADILVLQSTVNGLALRQQPVVAENTLIKRVPFGAEFLVLDPVDEARARVGVVNQWIKGRDIEGDEGYVAAWYLSAVKQPPLGPRKDKPVSSEPGLSQLVVRTTIDGLTLRQQPAIQAGNEIKYLTIDAELLVMEPASAALQKVGVNNQWLKVRDIVGDEGFVAAWYVVKRPSVNGI